MTIQRIALRFFIWILAAGLVFGLATQTRARDVYVPAPLKPWQEWVLHGNEEQLTCIPMYNNAADVLCAWPGRLTLTLTDEGGTFEQPWKVYSQARVNLPGSNDHWPTHVLVDGKPALVQSHDNQPGLILSAGSHVVKGEFSWRSLPERMDIPASTGLVALVVNNTPVKFPELDRQGRLWPKRRAREERIEDRLKVQCSRLIEDEIPARMSMEMTLEVAGQARQITMGPIYQSQVFTPVDFNSPLPARLESDGRLTIQVRPGRWSVHLDLRHAGPLETAEFMRPDHPFWPESETWAFSARPDLRRVEISGAPAVDPKQTTMPAKWQSYPAYLMTPATTLTFKQIKRGDPTPAPDQLALDRTLWLRFDGSGYFIQDKITGKKNTNWRLELDTDIQPGQVIVDGKEQLITSRKDNSRPGIELRNGKVNIIADSTYQKGISRIPATGWDHHFQNVKGRLNLPPGWTLVNAGGVDHIPGTWVSRWTLLDFFVVLIFTIALSRVYSKPLALLAFITLGLTFHEHDAPKYIWLAMLVGFTLLKHLPQGRMRGLVRTVQGMMVLAFAVMVIPFAIQTLRIGIYPELARPWTSMSETATQSDVDTVVVGGTKKIFKRQVNEELALEAPAPSSARLTSMATLPALGKSAAPDGYEVIQYDPKARTQTGPGMPLWPAYKTISFSWSGPVNQDQTLSLFLMGPKANLVLAFLRVGLIVLLAAGMFGLGRTRGKASTAPGIKQLLPALMAAFLCLTPTLSRAADFPSPAMLQELEKRLLAADDCFNSCADLPLASININAESLTLKIDVHAAIDTAIPVPGDENQWLPTSATVDGKTDAGLFRQEGRLWIMVPKGMHKVALSGPIRRQNGFQLVFPLPPHYLRMLVDGWTVEGRHADGSFDSQLECKRLVKATDTNREILETGVLPTFAIIERTLRLGLVWKVSTRVIRQGEARSGMVLDIPLLEGESITTQGIRVENRMAKINLKAGQQSLSWDSFLEPAGQIQLRHADTHKWTEVWKVDVSPIFHMEYQGIPVIFHKTGNRWYPSWHPWPGETLTLSVTRPKGIDGQTLTIEKSRLELSPGRAATTARLSLSIKSSQGDRHTITLPETATLQEVSIQGRIRPIRPDKVPGKNQVTVPIIPGHQEIVLQWVDKTGIRPFYRTPTVGLGIPSANACVDIKLARNRWPLFIGGEPAVGPAVLFWSEVLVILIIALVLSRTGWTPLNFFQWCLLFLGISMSHPAAAIVVAAWLVALEARPKADHLTGMKFNLVQMGLLALTLAAGCCLVFGISNGLLGHPDMSIRGNGSSAGLLRWYHDVSKEILPTAWVVSIPMWAYRVAMLVWALWVSFWLINILKWGWQRFATPQFWAQVEIRRPQSKKQPPQPAWAKLQEDDEKTPPPKSEGGKRHEPGKQESDKKD